MTMLHRGADCSTWGQPVAGIPFAGMLVGLLVATVAAADQRGPVTGQAVMTAPDVAPATFTRDAGPPPAAPEPPPVQVTPTPLPTVAPLTLSAPQPLTAKPPAVTRGPLPDWKLLLAVTVAFGILVAFRVVTASRTNRTPPLPPDVFDILGSASLGGGHALRVVRFGPKTLLVSTSTAGCQTLAELTDPQATDRIAAACAANGHPPRTVPRTRLPASRGDTGGRASA